MACQYPDWPGLEWEDDENGPWVGSDDGDDWKFVDGLLKSGDGSLSDLLRQGWRRFSLGYFGADQDEDQIEEAIDMICEAWGVPAQPEIQRPPEL